MSAGEELAVIGRAVGAAAGAVGVAAASAVAVTAAAAVTIAGTVLAVGVGAVGTALATGAAIVGTIGYGVVEAGKNAAEVAKIIKEDRQKVKEVSRKYIESVKADEHKSEEFIAGVITYFDENNSIYSKQEVESILSKEGNLAKRVEVASNLLELAGTYEMMLTNLQTAIKIAKELGISEDELTQEYDDVIKGKANLRTIKEKIIEVNNKIINWIKSKEEEILSREDTRVYHRETWNVITEERDVIASIYNEQLVNFFEKSDDKEIIEARLKIEINRKRILLMNMYHALSDLKGFPLFEEEARKILGESLALFQDDAPVLTDSGIDAMLDRSLEDMKLVYNKAVNLIGKEVVESKIKFEQLYTANIAYRKQIGLETKEYVFDENKPLESVESLEKENEQLLNTLQNIENNKAWKAKLTARFHKSGYIHIPTAATTERYGDVIKTTEYYLTPDEECVVVVSTYSDGRPAQIMVEGIALHEFPTADKHHILKVQTKYCADSAKILDGLYEGEIKRIEPREETAVAIHFENLPVGILARATKARKERTRKDNKPKSKYIGE